MPRNPNSSATPDSGNDVDPARDAWFLTGATASGKSSVALELAARLNAEILSLDSMAVYRGMDIGTAKPSAADQQAVPHHLIDLVDPAEDFSLAQYLASAERAIREIESRGKLPLFVGGTPLYLIAMLRGVEAGPPPDWEFRQHLQDVAAAEGNEAVHQRLQAVDPPTAERLHPADLRRVIRALEIHAATGRPMSESEQHFSQPIPQDQCRVFLLDWPRDELNQRINERVDAMFAAGWVEEVRQLKSAGPLGRTASQAVGYRQILEFLDAGGDLPQLVRDVQTTTRRFAKRQRTWFRSLGECRPIPMARSRSAAEIAQTSLEQSQV